MESTARLLTFKMVSGIPYSPCKILKVKNFLGHVWIRSSTLVQLTAMWERGGKRSVYANMVPTPVRVRAGSSEPGRHPKRSH